ncbi:MAG: hypothetical protein JRI85_04275 [Deltaproteobacteria bacterium]|nr:hypothetical protein [Deltaproteobacteria bacterium]
MLNKIRCLEYKLGILGLAVLVSIFILDASPALAHKVNVFAWLDGNTVYTESYFSGNKKVKNGLVEVFDPTGQKLLEGRTDEKGNFSFTLPQKTDLHIVLTASMGHKNDFNLKITQPVEGTAGPAKKEITAIAAPQKPVQADIEQIKAVVEEALDLRLSPIIRSLAEKRKESGPGVTEIIGGIGYIFGIMGLILYFRNRKKD